MISFDTLGRLIEGRFSISAHCFALGCGHSARLDLVELAERLGANFVAVGDPNPLVKLLRCQRCGGKDLGIILQPVTGYTDGPPNAVLMKAGPSVDRPHVKGRRARRRVRL
jgi:hypothetical protein